MERGFVLVIGIILFLVLLGFVTVIPEDFGLIYLIVLVLYLISITRFALS